MLDNRRERERVNTRLIETKTIGSHIVNYRKALSLLALLQFNNRAKRLLKVGLFYSSGMPCTFLRLLLPISFLSHISHFSPRRLFDELENLLKRIISFKLDENDKKKKIFCVRARVNFKPMGRGRFFFFFFVFSSHRTIHNPAIHISTNIDWKD